MKKFIVSVGMLIALVLAITLPATASDIQLTFNFVNLSNATFTAAPSGLTFGNATNILVTDNNNGASVTLISLDSGFTGSATHLDVGPPYEAEYGPGAAGSVIVATGLTTYLSGTMLDKSRFGAEYPNGAGAFLGEFHVDSLAPIILADLGLSGDHVDPTGSVSLTVGETSLTGQTLNGELGGGSITVEVSTPTPESSTFFLGLFGLIIAWVYSKRKEIFYR